MRMVSDEERRARISVRHGIAPTRRLAGPVEATEAMTVLHATEAPSVHLSVFARVDGLRVADVEAALYGDRVLVKQLAMRRTLFVFPRDLLPAALGSASARVADQERRKVVKDVVAAGMTANGDAWLDEACAAVLTRLAEGGLGARQLREQVPQIAGTVTVRPGTRWGGEIPVGPRVLTQLGARGEVVRGGNAGHWRISRPIWTLMSDWLGDVPTPLSSEDGYAELVRRWLHTFGPGTTTDIQWWLGSTVTAARRALADVDAVEVGLEGGATGWLLPEDLDPVAPDGPWAALLPVLDPTTMGWKQRDFYLGPHGPDLFDTNGNAGTTAWWNGRVVGCWIQDSDGRVVVVPLGDPGAEARTALQVEADRLTAWLDGNRVSTVYPSPLMKAAALGSRGA